MADYNSDIQLSIGLGDKLLVACKAFKIRGNSEDPHVRHLLGSFSTNCISTGNDRQGRA